MCRCDERQYIFTRCTAPFVISHKVLNNVGILFSFSVLKTFIRNRIKCRKIMATVKSYYVLLEKFYMTVLHKIDVNFTSVFVKVILAVISSDRWSWCFQFCTTFSFRVLLKNFKDKVLNWLYKQIGLLINSS